MDWYILPSLVLIAILVGMFIAKRYILLGSHVLLNILFVLCAVVALSALFWPNPFEYAADLSLRASGTQASFQQIDQQLNKVNPEDWWKDLNEFFGRGNSTENQQSSTAEQGFFMRQVYPGLLNSLTNLWRIIAFLVSVIIMLFGTYLSYSTYAASKIDHLEKEIKILKQRLDTQA